MCSNKLAVVTMLAFQDELEKSSGILDRAGSFMASRGAGLGAGMGLGAGVGGLGGLAIGGANAYEQAREQGAGVGEALHSSVGGAVGGAFKGVKAGIIAGGAAGALSGRHGADLAARLSEGHGYASSLARTGQRQVHAVTGWTPKAGLESIRGGAWGARQRLKAAENWNPNALKDQSLIFDMIDKVRGKAPARVGDQGRISKALGLASPAEKAVLETSRAKDHVKAVEEAVKHDMTNVPGVLKSLYGKDRGAALKAGLNAGWAGESIGNRLLNVGVPAGMLAASAMSKNDPEHKGERTGADVAREVGNFVAPMTVMPMAGGAVLGKGLSAVGGLIGKGVDKLRGRKQSFGMPDAAGAPGTESGGSPGIPIEKNYSNSALGRPPEGMLS